MTTFKRLFLLQGWLIIAGLSFLGCAGESADVGNGTEDSSPSGRYLVEGTIQGAAGLPIYLQRLDFSQINRPVVRSIDTVQADAQGRFRFSGSVREPLIGQIQVARDTFFIPLALRDRNIQIEAQRRDMGSIRIEGDPTSAQLAVLMLRLRRENEERGALLMERQRAQRSGDRQSLDATTAAYMQMITDQVDALKAYIDTVSDPVLAIFALESLSFREQFDFIAEFSEKLTGSHPEMRYTRELAAKVDGYERELRATQGNQMVGMQAPDITQPDREGVERRLSDLRGKVVLVDFWAAWCGPCRRENPNVVRVWKKYRDEGFEVFSVSLDSERAKWLAAIEKDGLAWKNHVSELNGFNSAAVSAYGVRGIPSAFLLDRSGKIVAQNLRGAQLENQVAALVGQ